RGRAAPARERRAARTREGRSRQPSPRGGCRGRRRTSPRELASGGAPGESCTVLTSATMDAAQALADLTEISSQIEAAVLFDESGSVQGSTLADESAAAELARGSADLLERAGRFRSEGEITQLEAATDTGSVFV